MNRLRGVPEVPLHPSISPQLRRWMVDMREIVQQLRQSQAPIPPPTNLKVTPEALGNFITWTRSPQADYHELLWSASPDITKATVVGVGNSQQWNDNVGKDGITRFYWVRAHRNTGARSTEVGYVSGTTLTAGTTVTPPAIPPQGQLQRVNTPLNRTEFL